MVIFDKKNLIFFSVVKFFNFWSSKPWNQNWIRIKLMRIRNPANDMMCEPPWCRWRRVTCRLCWRRWLTLRAGCGRPAPRPSPPSSSSWARPRSCPSCPTSTTSSSRRSRSVCGTEESVRVPVYAKLWRNATTCCAEVTRRFQKIRFADFFSERTRRFLHILWRHFCQILLRTKRILFHTYRNKLTNFYRYRILIRMDLHFIWKERRTQRRGALGLPICPIGVSGSW